MRQGGGRPVKVDGSFQSLQFPLPFKNTNANIHTFKSMSMRSPKPSVYMK